MRICDRAGLPVWALVGAWRFGIIIIIYSAVENDNNVGGSERCETVRGCVQTQEIIIIILPTTVENDNNADLSSRGSLEIGSNGGVEVWYYYPLHCCGE